MLLTTLEKDQVSWHVGKKNLHSPVDLRDIILAVCMAALSFLRALNRFKPDIVSCLCIVDATRSAFCAGGGGGERGERGRYQSVS